MFFSPLVNELKILSYSDCWPYMWWLDRDTLLLLAQILQQTHTEFIFTHTRDALTPLSDEAVEWSVESQVKMSFENPEELSVLDHLLFLQRRFGCDWIPHRSLTWLAQLARLAIQLCTSCFIFFDCGVTAATATHSSGKNINTVNYWRSTWRVFTCWRETESIVRTMRLRLWGKKWRGVESNDWDNEIDFASWF